MKTNEASHHTTTFSQLHSKQTPLVLVNVWDVWSALECQSAGHRALATSSHAVAEALGYRDGQNLPLAKLLRLVESISKVISVPLSVDFEAGFGDTPKEIGESVALVIDAGASGINIEDGLLAGSRTLIDAEQHCERISHARAAADRRGVNLFINARFDGMLLARSESDDLAAEAIRRSFLYKEAGADGLFVPGLRNLELIKRLSDTIEVPLNVMMDRGGPNVEQLTAAGASRISLGGAPFEYVRKAFRHALGSFSTDSRFFFPAK